MLLFYGYCYGYILRTIDLRLWLTMSNTTIISIIY